MNQTATRRVRQSASIAAAALRDPSTAEILRETGFEAVHDLPDRPARQAMQNNPADSLDFSDDSPQPFFDGSPWDIGWYGSEITNELEGD